MLKTAITDHFQWRQQRSQERQINQELRKDIGDFDEVIKTQKILHAAERFVELGVLVAATGIIGKKLMEKIDHDR